MNAHAPIVAEETAVSFIAEQQTPLAVLTSADEAEALFARIRAEIDAFVPDLSTVTSRAAIKSLAFKVTKTKTAVEAARKDKTEAWRKQTDAVNASGRVIKARLEQMEEEARKPLTEWEEAEKSRVERVANWFDAAERAAVILNDDTSEAVGERLATFEGMTLDADTFGDSLERAEQVRQQTVEVLRAAVARLIQAEADRAELDRLRAEAVAREEQDRLAKEAADVKAKEEADAIAAKQRDDEIARKASQDALAEAARITAKAQADLVAAHEAELSRLKKVADDKAAAEKAEADLVAQREKNRTHVSKIMAAAKLAIMGLGVTEDQAREVVKAIKAGSVPNVTIQF